MTPAHALVTWHQGLGAQRAALPPGAQSDLGLGQRTDCRARAVQLAQGCDCWGAEACCWSLEKGGLGAEKEPGGRHSPWGAVQALWARERERAVGSGGGVGAEEQLPGQTFWALWARVCSQARHR